MFNLPRDLYPYGLADVLDQCLRGEKASGRHQAPDNNNELADDSGIDFIYRPSTPPNPVALNSIVTLHPTSNDETGIKQSQSAPEDSLAPPGSLSTPFPPEEAGHRILAEVQPVARPRTSPLSLHEDQSPSLTCDSVDVDGTVEEPPRIDVA